MGKRCCRLRVIQPPFGPHPRSFGNKLKKKNRIIRRLQIFVNVAAHSLIVCRVQATQRNASLCHLVDPLVFLRLHDQRADPVVAGALTAREERQWARADWGGTRNENVKRAAIWCGQQSNSVVHRRRGHMRANPFGIAPIFCERTHQNHRASSHLPPTLLTYLGDFTNITGGHS